MKGKGACVEEKEWEETEYQISDGSTERNGDELVMGLLCGER